jgi:hypothetical protein
LCDLGCPYILAQMSNVLIDCNAPLWRNALKTNLQEGNEVNLVNVDYTIDGVFCELLAFAHGMTFQLDAKNSAGSFRLHPQRER